MNASRTLNSLAKLVGSLSNMVVLDKIQEKVVFALECLDNVTTLKEIIIIIIMKNFYYNLYHS